MMNVFADSNELHDVVAVHLNCATLFLAAASRAMPRGEASGFIDMAETAIRTCWGEARVRRRAWRRRFWMTTA